MPVQISTRDESIFLDIYDFGYVDFKYLWSMYWPHIEDEKIARNTINNRMRKLAAENFIALLKYRSITSKTAVGQAPLVFTLAGKGMAYVRELYGERLNEFDPNKRYRKGAYIEHHLELAHLTMKFKKTFNDYVIDVRGEMDAKYVIPKEKLDIDLFKPDLLWMLGKKDNVSKTAFFVEYERTLRRSEKKMKDKLRGQSEYASNGIYESHDVLKSNEINNRPVLLYISENKRLNYSYNELLKLSEFKWYNDKKEKRAFFSDILFTTKEEFMEEPTGDIFHRYSRRNYFISLEHVYYINQFCENFERQGTTKTQTVIPFPAATATRVINRHWFNLDFVLKIKKEGQNGSRAYLVLYVKNIEILETLAESMRNVSLNNHPILGDAVYADNKFNPKLICLVSNYSFDSVVTNVRVLDWGPQLSTVLVAKVEDVLEEPLTKTYFEPQTNQYVTL